MSYLHIKHHIILLLKKLYNYVHTNSLKKTRNNGDKIDHEKLQKMNKDLKKTDLHTQTTG